MTRCISKGFTRHFGVICSHHQWLARLDCLSTDFGTDLVQHYFPLCSRSILAKAQLYSWVNTITGRTWLVEVGDSNEVHDVSPGSLARGYMGYDVVDKAPSCLRASSSSPTAESFEHVVSTCGFTGETEHTENPARPWEYNEGLRSMVALDSETAGYDRTGHRILNGEYVDKECLCTSYLINVEQEPCGNAAQSLDLTRERLWMMATCGLNSIPHNWTKSLTTIGEAFILLESWNWPAIIISTLQHPKILVERCTTEACEIDERGYCRTKQAVDRACFCADLSYESCGKGCQNFETRIAYVNWLHQTCGAVHGWHGLPKDWKRLAQPSPQDLIPWQWPVIGSEDRDPLLHITLMLLNFLVISVNFGSHMFGSRYVPSGLLLLSTPRHWFFRGISIVAFQILGNWMNALVIGNTPGHEGISILQMVLLWCSTPRLAWLLCLLTTIQPLEDVDLTAAASALWAEIILQALSSYHLLMTIVYGFEHGFYFGRLAGVEKGGSALLMYCGALMWLIVVGLTLLQLMKTNSVFLRRWHRIDRSCKSLDGGHIVSFDERFAWIDEQFAHYWMGRFRGIYYPAPRIHDNGRSNGYGSINNIPGNRIVESAGTKSLYALAIISMILLSLSQLLFWIGLMDIM
jgi:hypothetical protein